MILDINENFQVKVYFRHSCKANVTYTKTTTLKNATKIIKVETGVEYYSNCFIVDNKTGHTLSQGWSICSIHDSYDKRKGIWHSFKDALKSYQYELNYQKEDNEKSLIELFVANQPTIDKFIEEFSKYNKNKDFYRFFYDLPRELKPKIKHNSLGI